MNLSDRTLWAVGLAVLVLMGVGHPAQVPPASHPADCEAVASSNTECFVVHGRVFVTAGLRTRIWIVGTKRWLGIDNENDLPDNIGAVLTPENRVYGDFVVCPITPEEPGKMRFVRLCSGSNLVVEMMESSNGKWISYHLPEKQKP